MKVFHWQKWRLQQKMCTTDTAVHTQWRCCTCKSEGCFCSKCALAQPPPRCAAGKLFAATGYGLVLDLGWYRLAKVKVEGHLNKNLANHATATGYWADQLSCRGAGSGWSNAVRFEPRPFLSFKDKISADLAANSNTQKWPSRGRMYAPKCVTPGVSVWSHCS